MLCIFYLSFWFKPCSVSLWLLQIGNTYTHTFCIYNHTPTVSLYCLCQMKHKHEKNVGDFHFLQTSYMFPQGVAVQAFLSSLIPKKHFTCTSLHDFGSCRFFFFFLFLCCIYLLQHCQSNDNFPFVLTAKVPVCVSVSSMWWTLPRDKNPNTAGFSGFTVST